MEYHNFFQSIMSIPLTLNIFKKAHKRKDNYIVVKKYDSPGIIEPCKIISIKRLTLSRYTNKIYCKRYKNK